MKTRSILLSTVLMAAVAPVFAQATSCIQMDRSTPGMQKSETAQFTGVVRAIDTAKGTVTIQRQAILSILGRR